MKLERIALSHFLSHTDTEWSPDGARLVTLVGANGAGKSTLAADSILFALFDEARGKTDQLVQLGATDMSVLVEFTFGGARYRVTRGRTTRSGGKSFLELAIADGDTWRPLTGDTIRDTEQLIADLLRLDAASFETAVLLGQGHANRFAEATAAERKRLLSQILGLDVYARAEARARELARDLEVRTAAGREQVGRLETRLEERPGVEERLAGHRADLEANAEQLAIGVGARDALTERIGSIDVELAAADAIAGQVAALEAERAGLTDQWRRANERKAATSAAIADAERTLTGAGEVAAAAARLLELRTELEVLIAAQAEDRRVAGEIETKRRALDELRRAHAETVRAWTAQADPLRGRLATLEDEARHAEHVTCPKCKTVFPAGAERIRASIEATRAELAGLGEQPAEPVRISLEAAAVARLESRRRELAFDPISLTDAHRQVADLERTAARGEAIAGARATLERERAAIADVETDLARISGAGAAAKARLEALTAASAESGPLRAERARIAAEQAQTRSLIELLERSRRVGEQLAAREEADLEQLDAVAREHAELAGSLEAAGVELARLRRLVTAFGVTGIPARIIESVLPELAGYANELLAELRPGMTLELRAQRAKKDGTGVVEALDLIVRDDVGERGLAMFSGGERTSCSLALAVALSRLVARRAGSRVESLIVDEPDGLDGSARRAFGQALRVIAHRGELSRVVLVSHHPDLAEFGDATFEVRKGPNGSIVEQVA